MLLRAAAVVATIVAAACSAVDPNALTPFAEFLYALTGSQKSSAIEKCMVAHVSMAQLAGEGIPPRPESQPPEAFMLRVLGEARPSLWPLVHCLAENDLLTPGRFLKVAPHVLLAAVAAAGDGSSQAPFALVEKIAGLPLALLGTTSDGRTLLHVAFDRGKSVVEGVLLAALSEVGASSHYVKTLKELAATLKAASHAGGEASTKGDAESGGLPAALGQTVVKARVPVEDSRAGASVLVGADGDATDDAAAAAAAAAAVAPALRELSLPVGRSLRVSELDAFLVSLSAGLVRTLLPLIEAQPQTGRGLPLLLQLLSTRDALGRTPLHAAAAVGDAASVGVICDRLAAHVPEGVFGADASTPTPGSPAVAASIAASIPWLKDATGYTPRELAQLLGGHASRATVRAFAACEQRLTTAAAPLVPSEFAASSLNAGVREGLRTAALSRSFAAVAPESARTGATMDAAKDSGASNAWPRPHPEPPSLAAAVAALASASPSGCDIDVVDVSACATAADVGGCAEAILPREHFLRDFALPGRPVLIRGAALPWPVTAAWATPAALDSLPLNFSAAEIPGARQWGLRASGRLPPASFLRVLALGQGGPNCSGTGAAAAENSSALCAALRSPANAPGRRAAAGAAPVLPWPRAPLLFNGELTPVEPAHVGVVDLLTVIPWFLRGRLPLWPREEGGGDAVSLVSMEPLPPEVSVSVAVPGAGTPLRPTVGGASTLDVAVSGARRWALLPPDRAEHSTIPALLYAGHVLAAPRGVPKSAQPLRCEQRAGDALFLPRRWAGGWLAVDSGIGYDVRFASPLDRY